MHYVYLLKNEKGNFIYIGCTGDLRKRIEEHSMGIVQSTKSQKPLSLVYYEAYISKEDAFHREHNLKLRANALTGLKRRLKSSLSKAL